MRKSNVLQETLCYSTLGCDHEHVGERIGNSKALRATAIKPK